MTDKKYYSRREAITEAHKRNMRKIRKRKAFTKNRTKFLLYAAKSRAKRKNLEFRLAFDDLIVPEMCPVLGIPLKHAVGHSSDNSPSIDRIDPTRGYTKDNVIVVSHRANQLKSNGTLEELDKVLKFYSKLQNPT